MGTYAEAAGWVRQVAWNLATSRLRHLQVAMRHLARQRVEHVDGPGPDRVALTRALATLPPNHRLAVVLHHLGHLSVAEIAHQRGVAEGTVKSWLSRGRSQLAEYFVEKQEPEWRDVTARTFRPDGVEAAASTVQRRRKMRRSALAAALVLLAAIPIAILLGTHGDKPPIIGPTTPPSSPSPLPVAPSPTLLPSPTPVAQVEYGIFQDVTITVPSWGVPADARCVEGKVKIGSGQYVREDMRPVNVLSYLESDVDQDGDEDYVAHLMCSEGPESPATQIVAFRLAGDELVPIGRVIGTQDGMEMMDYMQAKENGRIAVYVSRTYTDSGQNSVPSQWRTYAWQDGRFRQVAGPTSFPDDPPTAALTVNHSDLVFRRAANEAYIGELTITVGLTGAPAVIYAELSLFLPGGVNPTGDGWAGWVSRSSPRETVLDYRISGLATGSVRTLHLEVVSLYRPVLDDDPPGLPNHHLHLRQIEPFTDTFVSPNFAESVITVVLP